MRAYVGEVLYAIESGVLAQRAISESLDYDKLSSADIPIL